MTEQDMYYQLMLQEEERRRQEEMRLEEERRRIEESYMRNQQAGQQEQQGVNPGQAYNIYDKFAGAGAGSGIGVEAGAGTTGEYMTSIGAGEMAGANWGGTAAGTGAGTGAGASGGTAGSAFSAAGPWAALAAAIAANETWANDQGRRPDDFGEHMGDLFTGKVLERDAEALGDSIGGPFGEVIETGGQLGHPKGVYDVGVDIIDKGKDVTRDMDDLAKKGGLSPKQHFDWLKKAHSPWEWF